MKKNRCFLVFIGLAFCFYSCTPLEIEFNDPQDVELIHEAHSFIDMNGNLQSNNDLVELFGEGNIHFGPVPPTWGDSICFKINGMEYDTCVRFIFDTYNNNAIIPSHADPPEFDASVNTHLFYDQNQCVFKHKMNTRDTYGNNYFLDLKTAYIIGHDNLFTTYFQGKIEGNGNPTVIMIISGTLVIEDGVIIGVKDYIFGKKILDYDYQPTNAYAPGTIEIKKHPGLSPCCEWIAK